MGASAFAIYLNSNARRVSPDVVSRIEDLVHPDDIYYAHTQEDARELADRILERGYPTVFTGGGDGTVCGFINALHGAAGSVGARGLPTLGVLSLGTGNALSRLVSSGSAIQDLKAYVTNPTRDHVHLPLVECEGQLFPFGGAGIDAEILADYDALKERIGDGPLKPLLKNVVGYFVAFFSATGPRKLQKMIRGENLTIKVTNLGDNAYEVGEEGDRSRAYGSGEIMFEGPTNAIIAGTIPMIGYGARLLPMTDNVADFMQLRVVRIGVARALVSLPEIWSGDYRGEGFRDFLTRKVRVQMSEPAPFQVAGDLVGHRDVLDFELVPDAIKLLRFI
ncbi:MAG: hypothetical protein ISR64_07790 [Deltaproteobacteria bacterium]|nr:hypothetical protein [Deltaproteobacteria bacterium]